MPYLHERRIYLNKLKPGIEYFYTTIETTYEAERNYYRQASLAVLDGKQATLVDIDEAMKTPTKTEPGKGSFTTIIGMNAEASW